MSELVAPVTPVASNQGIDNFLHGFSLMASLSQKRQQQELAAQKMIQDNELRNQQFSLAQEKQNVMAQRDSILNQGTLANIQLQRDKLESDQRDGNEIDSQTAAMTKEMSAIPFDPGTDAYKSKQLEIMSRYPKALTDPSGRAMIRDAAKYHDDQFKTQQAVFNTQLKNLALPYDVFENPSVWQKDPAKPDSRFVELRTDNLTPINPSIYKQDPKTGLRVNPVNNTVVPTRIVTIDNSKFETLHDTYKSLFGNPDTGRPKPTSPLDEATAKQYLDKAHGDKAAARQMAKDDGFSF